MNCPGGALAFGAIPADVATAVGIPSGPVRLQNGIPGSRGFGLRHIEDNPGRMQQFLNIGFNGVAPYVLAIASNYEHIAEDPTASRIALVRRHLEHDCVLIVQYNAGGFWSVTTALPYRVSRRKILWSRQAGGSEPPPDAPVLRPRFATLSLPLKPRDSES